MLSMGKEDNKSQKTINLKVRLPSQYKVFRVENHLLVESNVV
jgi:hypothetical protein